MSLPAPTAVCLAREQRWRRRDIGGAWRGHRTAPLNTSERLEKGLFAKGGRHSYLSACLPRPLAAGFYLFLPQPFLSPSGNCYVVRRLSPFIKLCYSFFFAVVCLSVCLSVCLPACLPAWLSVCLSVCLSACMSAFVCYACMYVGMRPCLYLCISVSISKCMCIYIILYVYDSPCFESVLAACAMTRCYRVTQTWPGEEVVVIAAGSSPERARPQRGEEGQRVQ